MKYLKVSTNFSGEEWTPTIRPLRKTADLWSASHDDDDDDDEFVVNSPTPCQIVKHPPAPKQSGRPARGARWRRAYVERTIWRVTDIGHLAYDPLRGNRR